MNTVPDSELRCPFGQCAVGLAARARPAHKPHTHTQSHRRFPTHVPSRNHGRLQSGGGYESMNESSYSPVGLSAAHHTSHPPLRPHRLCRNDLSKGRWTWPRLPCRSCTDDMSNGRHVSGHNVPRALNCSHHLLDGRQRPTRLKCPTGLCRHRRCCALGHVSCHPEPVDRHAMDAKSNPKPVEAAEGEGEEGTQ